VTKDEVVVLGAVLPELLLEFGRCLRLDVAHGRSKTVSHTHETLIRTSVPGLVADRPRGKKCHAEGMSRRALGSSSGGLGAAVVTAGTARRREEKG
jgi:hypothetical protein